jgi:hypothetical protein
MCTHSILQVLSTLEVRSDQVAIRIVKQNFYRCKQELAQMLLDGVLYNLLGINNSACRCSYSRRLKLARYIGSWLHTRNISPSPQRHRRRPTDRRIKCTQQFSYRRDHHCQMTPLVNPSASGHRCTERSGTSVDTTRNTGCAIVPMGGQVHTRLLLLPHPFNNLYYAIIKRTDAAAFP